MIIGITGLDIEIERVIIKNFRQYEYPVIKSNKIKEYIETSGVNYR